MKKILIIDDEDAIRDLLKLALLDNGYHVYEASCGKEGLEIFKENDPDIVLTDVKMPNMSGIEVVKEIKTIKSNADIVIMTGYGTEDTVIDALRAGASNYVKKPISFDELFTILNNIIYNRENEKRYEIVKDVVIYEQKKLVIDNDISKVWGIVNQILFNIMPIINSKKIDGMKLGLYELIINAIEHGNLCISYEEKTLALRNGSYLKLITEKSKEANKKAKRVYINCDFNREKFTVEIIDQGKGFNYKELIDINDPGSIMSAHGRGIFLASLYFDKLKYKEPGNRVKLVKNLKNT